MIKILMSECQKRMFVSTESTTAIASLSKPRQGRHPSSTRGRLERELLLSLKLQQFQSRCRHKRLMGMRG